MNVDPRPEWPVSVKAVVFTEDERVVLLRNERNEWELPGGRLEPGETPQECAAREFDEELGVTLDIGPLLDVWLSDVLPGRQVLVVTYGGWCDALHDARCSHEHSALGFSTLDELRQIPLPEGYRRAIAAWHDAPRRITPV